MRNSITRLILLIVGTFGAGYFGSLFPPDVWYSHLVKPGWTPAGPVIGAVWAVLYVLMIVAMWRVWRAPSTALSRRGLTLYAAQLVLNGLWSYVFFGQHLLLAATLHVLLLLAVLLYTASVFRRVDAAAAWLLAPYILWIAFDLCWHARLWTLNA